MKLFKIINDSSVSFVQFIQFVAVGLLNTALGYTIYAGMTLNGFSASNALILTYLIAVPLNFITTGRLVFGSSSLQPLLRFIFFYIGVFTINWAALRLIMNIGLGQLLAQAVIVPFISVLSFLIFKYAVFKRH